MYIYLIVYLNIESCYSWYYNLNIYKKILNKLRRRVFILVYVFEIICYGIII